MSIAEITVAALSNGVEAPKWCALAKRFLERQSKESDSNRASELITGVLLPYLLSGEPVHPLIYQYINTGLHGGLIVPSDVLSGVLEIKSVPNSPQDKQKLRVFNIIAPAVSLVDLETSQLFMNAVSDLLATSPETASPMDDDDFGPLISAVERCGGPTALLTKLVNLSSDGALAAERQFQDMKSSAPGVPGLGPTSPDCLATSRSDTETFSTPLARTPLIPASMSLALYQLTHDPERSWKSSSSHTPQRSKVALGILDIASAFAGSPSNFLYYLVAGSLEQLLAALEATRADIASGTPRRKTCLVGEARAGLHEMIWVKHGLVSLLQTWKDGLPQDGRWTYPDNLVPILQDLLPRFASRLSAADQLLQHQYELLWGKGAGFHEGAGGHEMDLGFDYLAYEGAGAASSGLLPILDVFLGSLRNASLLQTGDVSYLNPGGSISDSGDPGPINIATYLAENADERVFRLLLSHQNLEEFSLTLLQQIQAPIAALDNLFPHLSESPSTLVLVGTANAIAAFEDGLKTFDLLKSLRIDDAQGGMIQYGQYVLCIQGLFQQLSLPQPEAISSASSSHGEADLTVDERKCLAGWVKALFGTSGIDEEIMQATPPPRFLRLAPSVVAQACAAAQDGVISFDTLKDGLSYFDQELLSWSLGNVLEWLAREILRQGAHAAYHIEIISTLLSATNLPPAVVRFQRPNLEALLGTGSLEHVLKKVGICLNEPLVPQPKDVRHSRHLITDALQSLRAPETATFDLYEAVALLGRLREHRRTLELLLIDLDYTGINFEPRLWIGLLLLPDGTSELPLRDFINTFIVQYLETSKGDISVVTHLVNLLVGCLLRLKSTSTKTTVDDTTNLARRLFVEISKSMVGAGAGAVVDDKQKGRVKVFIELLLRHRTFVNSFPFLERLKTHLI